MTLLGTPLVITLAVAVIVAPPAVCALWSRIRGPVVVRAAVRGAMILGAQCVAIALVAALINDYGLFYRNWSELAAGAEQFAGLTSRTDPAVPAMVRRGSAEQLVATFQPGYRDARRWPETGRLESVVVHGVVSGLSESALVYLPPQYFQRSYATDYFPAIEVLTGYPGIEQYLVSRLKYPTVLRKLIQRQRAGPAVLVMMRPAVTYPRDTECTDVPGGPAAETFFGVDVPAQVETSYRVMQSGWGAVGDSTGGYCATKIAMLNFGRFSAAAEMSGYFFALRDSTTADLWCGSRVLRESNDLAWRLRHLPAPPISLLEGTSTAERGPDGYAEAMRFVRLVRSPMRVSVMTVPHGGHNIATWSAEVPAALSWLTARLPSVSAAPTMPVNAQRDLGMAPTPILPRS